MKRLDDYPIDPDVAAALDAIDATLAGEPVDPEHAELAELALLLAVARPEIEPGFARSLDARVERRFAAAGPAPARRPWRWGWEMASGTALAAVIAGVVVLSSGGSGSSSGPQMTSAASGTVAGAASSSAGHGTPTLGLPSRAASARPALPRTSTAASSSAVPKRPAGSGLVQNGSVPGVQAPINGPAGLLEPTRALQPPANGRKIIQSAQIALTSAPTRIDDVAQQVFNVVGAENGIVNQSTVTATGGPDGYAEFELSVPSAGLPDTMAQLSRLRYAQVASRTDITQDVNNQFVDANRRLADARALRTALLKQLANAVTQTQINSLNAQIHDAEASIASDQATLRVLNRQVDYSQISLTINARAIPVTHGTSGSFTIGRAAHDAGRVLTVAAGVALIALAALVPVALLGALAGWIAVAVRRRRREQALDLA